ncbi:hypothetical protein [Rhodocista pekingensis]|uniref:Quinol:cytochrome c oxidoreductase quinone-binding subunit 2 n=1 Tax=Rhodocista pekingensis TaxID=201185 RepID=A0ABW2KR12_9PROT
MSTTPPRRFAAASLAVAAVGAALSVALALGGDADAAVAAWHAAVVVWSAIPVGCVLLLLLNHLIGRAVVLPAVLEAGCRTLWLLAVAMLPGLLALDRIYPWTAADFVPSGPLQSWWLTGPAFLLRTALYFAVWIALSEAMIREDRSVGPRHKRPGLAAAGLVLHSIIASFAAVDWIMTLTPDHASAAFGIVYAAHQAAAALAFGVLADHLVSREREPEATARGLLIAGALAWGYIAFFEYLTVWTGDLPHLAVWFLERQGGVWPSLRWLAGLLTLAGVALALAAPLGRARRWLPAAAGLLLAAQIAEAFWLVLPAAKAGPALSAAFALTVGGLWSALFFRVLARRPEHRPGRQTLPPGAAPLRHRTRQQPEGTP